MNTQRRIFRGRGGPTDGRLPKHNARRRKPPKTEVRANEAEPKYPGPAPWNQTRHGLIEEELEEGLGDVEGQDQEDDEQSNQDKTQNIDSRGDLSGTSPLGLTTCVPGTSNDDNNVLDEGDETKKQCLVEIKHLKRRLRNVQEGIQTSNSVGNPTSYKQNVLNPVQNCVNEWRSIARHYGTKKVKDCNDHDIGSEPSCSLTDESRKDAGLAVFQLIQLSVQSGPLRGGKPGYFKRCGSDVARTVLTFLEEVIPNNILGGCMGFSTKQMQALNLWQSNAQKASLSDKAPSKSAVTVQQIQQKH
jgi:hypothetical protein